MLRESGTQNVASASLPRSFRALRPVDIDMVQLFGYGHPRWRGGPMKYADMQGLDKILGSIRKFEKEDAWFWTPAPLLEQLVAEGRTFDDLNRDAA